MKLELIIGNCSFKTRGTLFIIFLSAALSAIIGSGLTPTTNTTTTIHTSVSVDDHKPEAIIEIATSSPTMLAQKQ